MANFQQPVITAARVQHQQVHDSQNAQVDTRGQHFMAQSVHYDQRKDIPDCAYEEDDRINVDCDCIGRILFVIVEIVIFCVVFPDVRIGLIVCLVLLFRHFCLKIIYFKEELSTINKKNYLER